MTERISKVGFKDGLIVINTSRTSGDQEKHTMIKCFKSPHADFLAAFSALEAHVRDILELPTTVWKDRIKITGVSFSLSEGTDVEGAVITGQAALEECDAPLCFNTPHMPFEQYSEGGCAKLMPGEAVEALEDVRREAREFLDGKSAQGDLFDGKAAAAGDVINKVQEVGRANGMPQSTIDEVKADYSAERPGALLDAAGNRPEPEPTISINGGPAAPMSVVKEAVRIVKAARGRGDKPEAHR